MSTAPKTYSVDFKFNGETITKRTSDIKQTLEAIRPPVLLTEMYVTVKNGKEKIERKLNLHQARRVFQDDIMREIFINNLLLR